MYFKKVKTIHGFANEKWMNTENREEPYNFLE